MRKAVRSFASRARLRGWFARNHSTAKELNLRCFKVHARERGVTYGDALEEALCFGWIDGVRHALDADSFVQRFTPRRPGSNWSRINRARLRKLDAQGLLTPAGRSAWQAAPKRPAGYSFESRAMPLARPYLAQLEANSKAFAYFQQQPPWYRRTSSFWVMSAKKEETRQRRLESLIECCAGQRPIGPLARKPARKKAQ